MNTTLRVLSALLRYPDRVCIVLGAEDVVFLCPPDITLHLPVGDGLFEGVERARHQADEQPAVSRPHLQGDEAAQGDGDQQRDAGQQLHDDAEGPCPELLLAYTEPDRTRAFQCPGRRRGLIIEVQRHRQTEQHHADGDEGLQDRKSVV